MDILNPENESALEQDLKARNDEIKQEDQLYQQRVPCVLMHRKTLRKVKATWDRKAHMMFIPVINRKLSLPLIQRDFYLLRPRAVDLVDWAAE